MARILLVDDDAEALTSLARALRANGLDATIDAATNPEKALLLAKEGDPHAAVLDLSLDATRGVESGFALMGQLLAAHPLCRIIVLTGHGTSEFGIRALTLGAANFLQKPADITHLRALLRDAIAHAELKREHQRLLTQSRQGGHSRLVGDSLVMQRVREEVQYLAQNSQAALIVGETGTGKGVCALEIHRLSARSTENFMRYQPNFATADLVNSELFGHMKGSFTGATESRRGLLHEADRGVLFLDEIDQLPVETQVALLGALQDQVVRAVGSNRDERVDFRLICASNADLEKSLAEGKLRKDFYHRVAHYTLRLPPLRERKEDIPQLAALTLSRMQERGMVSVSSFAADGLQKLASHDWPGNVRELEAVVEGAAYHAQFKRRAHITAEDVTLHGGASNGEPLTFSAKVEAYKQKLIRDALETCGGNQARAAELLGLDRGSMRRVMGRG